MSTEQNCHQNNGKNKGGNFRKSFSELPLGTKFVSIVVAVFLAILVGLMINQAIEEVSTAAEALPTNLDLAIEKMIQN